jgi:hypothetical protein
MSYNPHRVKSGQLSVSATVGGRWDGLTAIFSSGSAILYGIQPNGDLLW